MKTQREGGHLQTKERRGLGETNTADTLILDFQLLENKLRKQVSVV